MKSQHLSTEAWKIDEKQFPAKGSGIERLTFLLHYAILAPSSHNSQPWKFLVTEEEIRVFLDLSRWLKVADSDQRELHISIGCALENLLIAAEHFGISHQVEYLPEPADPLLAARIRFFDKPFVATRASYLFSAIPIRHTNHKLYDGRMISVDCQEALLECGEPGISLFLSGDPEIKHSMEELVVRADAIEFADPEFREELGYWIGQGVFGTSWLLAKLGQLSLSYLNPGKQIVRKDYEVLMSSPLLGLLLSHANTREWQIRTGQVFERIYLMCAHLGIRLQPISQILQVPEVKSEVIRLLPIEEGVPQQPFRLGYAQPERDHTPRRPLEDTLL